MPTSFFFNSFASSSERCSGIVLGERRAGVNRILAALQRPGVFPLLALAQARGLVAQDRQQRDTFPLDQLGHQPRHVERGIIPIKLADLEEIRVLTGDIRQLADGGQRDGESGRGFPLVVHAAVEVEVGFETVEEPGVEGTFELRFPGLGVPAAFVFGLFDEGDVWVGLDDFDSSFDESLISLRPLGVRFGEAESRCAVRTRSSGSRQTLSWAITISKALWPRLEFRELSAVVSQVSSSNP